MNKHLVIPDLQIRPGVCVNHLNALGNYIVDQQPDVIIQTGNFAAMPSLNPYVPGEVMRVNASYGATTEAARKALAVLMGPLIAYNAKCRRNKKKQYRPDLILTLGDHEGRIAGSCNRYVEKRSIDDLGYARYGWDVCDFLEVVERDGVAYSHFFPRDSDGQVLQTISGAPDARAQVQREQQSCTAGHSQGLSFHVQQLRNRRHYGLIAGSFYMHEEDCNGPQGTAYWRGVIVKHDVNNGNYDPMFVSMKYLLDSWWDGKERYV